MSTAEGTQKITGSPLFNPAQSPPPREATVSPLELLVTEVAREEIHAGTVDALTKSSKRDSAIGSSIDSADDEWADEWTESSHKEHLEKLLPKLFSKSLKASANALPPQNAFMREADRHEFDGYAASEDYYGYEVGFDDEGPLSPPSGKASRAFSAGEEPVSEAAAADPKEYTTLVERSALPRVEVDNTITYKFKPTWDGFGRHRNHEVGAISKKGRYIDIKMLMQVAINSLRNPIAGQGIDESERDLLAILNAGNALEVKVDKGFHQFEFEYYEDNDGNEIPKYVGHITVKVNDSKAFHIYFSPNDDNEWAYHSTSS